MEGLNLDFIKNRRNEKNISLQSMAESLGFKNASTYMKYENGEYLFKANHLPMLAERLDCKIDELYFFEKNISKIETTTVTPS
jgi:transcriptional regulator with XRE-family HTH domain